MPKEREGSPPEAAEKNTQSEQVREPVHRDAISRSPDQGQPVFNQMAALQQQLAEAQAKLAQHEAKRDHQRKLKAESQQRRRQNLGDQGRAQHAEYMREWRARQRQQSSSAEGEEPTVLPREEQLERQLAAAQAELARRDREAQAKLAQHEAKREQKNEWQRGYRERHLEAVRQRDAAYRRKRRARERGKNSGQ